MELHELKPAEGSIKSRKKRLGRGGASGKGGTSSRGHKGAKSRSGYSAKIGFEGGQMPLQRRIPKFGFKNINRKVYVPINLSEVQRLVDKGVVEGLLDRDVLYKNRIIKKDELVKILGVGDLTAKLDFSVNAYSKKAKEVIEKLGGRILTAGQ